MESDNLKQKFVEMCKFITPYKGGFIYSEECIESDNDYSYITTNEHYNILKVKMDNLIRMINSDLTLFDRDIENDLWPII
jgi:hypothetical protein